MDPVLPGEISAKISLQAGDNEIVVKAYNDLGIAQKVIRVYYEATIPKPNLYVLSIGISKYAYLPGDLQLHYAHLDAQDIAAAFATQEGRLFYKVETVPLLDEGASRGDILDSLDWILRQTTQYDVAIIFVSGHGMLHEVGEDYYFLPHDGDPERLRSTAILWSQFDNVLERLPGLSVLFVDTCHAGGVAGEGKGWKAASLDLAIRDLTTAGRGAFIMASSTGPEISLERSEWGHGAFTKAILEGLEGRADYDGNGVIYINELDLYVTDWVKELTRGAQHPTTKKSTDITAFPLFALAWGGAEPTSTPVDAVAKGAETATDTPTPDLTATETAIAQGIFATLTAQAPAPTDTPAALAAGSIKINPVDGAEMVFVPSGEFTMGSGDDDPDADSDEKPQHTVYLDAFWIYKTEVTNAQYRKCVEVGACTLPHKTWYYDNPAYADHPVVYVDWYQAKAFCEWAGGRLPTEAEWEKAARGTDGRIYPWGNEWDANKLNSSEAGPGTTTKVGDYPTGASPYGALGMAGNVWEWAGSLYRDYPYNPEDGREDPGAEGIRVLRGGSFNHDERFVRCASRGGHYRNSYLGRYGFRVVLSP